MTVKASSTKCLFKWTVRADLCLLKDFPQVTKHHVTQAAPAPWPLTQPDAQLLVRPLCFSAAHDSLQTATPPLISPPFISAPLFSFFLSPSASGLSICMSRASLPPTQTHWRIKTRNARGLGMLRLRRAVAGRASLAQTCSLEAQTWRVVTVKGSLWLGSE